MREFEALTPAQQGAIRALLRTPNRSKAAAEAGVGESTLYRWLTEDAFKTAYRAAQRDLHDQTVALLHAAADDAVTALKDVLTDSDAPAPSRVSAAKIVLELCGRAVEQDDLLDRIARLESLHREMANQEHPRAYQMRVAR